MLATGMLQMSGMLLSRSAARGSPDTVRLDHVDSMKQQNSVPVGWVYSDLPQVLDWFLDASLWLQA